MIRKLLVVCGPTAVGKTSLAVNLAKKFNGELVSADSRQVYRGMDIGTGKDVPYNSKLKTSSSAKASSDVRTLADESADKQNSKLKYKYYQIDGVKIWGYDLAEPNKDFSVSKYFDIAGKIITGIWNRNKLPVIVGGTGFYIKALIDGIGTISTPPDYELRKKLGVINVNELFEILAGLDKKKAESMNDSDRNNPRRLIRAIEIAKQATGDSPSLEALRAGGKYQVSSVNKIDYDSLMIIGLTAPKAVLNKRIEDRVRERIKQGFEKEVKKLIKNNIVWKYKSMQGMGYRQYEDYFINKGSLKEFIRNWILAEQKYAKRQLTWFKKDKRVNWFDITSRNFESNVEKYVQSWYHEIGNKN